jgi:putative Mn2+ efflux pump MntP
MDCFTVSIVSGVLMGRLEWATVLRLSFFFGLFQAVMPLIGWLCTSHFAAYIEAYDHWIAFAMLAFIGVKMIRDAFMPEEHHSFNPRRLRTQLLLSVATSIDALAIGISLAVTGYTTIGSLLEPLVWIGVGSFIFGLLGHALGVRFGRAVSRLFKPELFGGAILLFIGVKILLSHLYNL